MIDHCPRCGREALCLTSATTLISCPACDAEYISAHAARLTLLTQGHEGGSQARSAFDLPREFTQRFRLGVKLGCGAAGMVFQATHVPSGRPVAVKFLQLSDSPEALGRFERERILLDSLCHSNIVRVFSSGQISGHPYLVMEYLAGGTLRDLLRDEGRLDPWRAGLLILDCLAGLAECHRRGIVHRDIKPENVLLTEDGRSKMADLGIAKDFSSLTNLTLTGGLIGTPKYMSPEQVRGEPVCIASDIYSVGLVLYEMIAGRLPFDCRSVGGYLIAHSAREPTEIQTIEPSIPSSLARLIHETLAKRIGERPQSASDLSTRLARCIGLRPEGLNPPAPVADLEEEIGDLRPAPVPASIQVPHPSLVHDEKRHALGDRALVIGRRIDSGSNDPRGSLFDDPDLDTLLMHGRDVSMLHALVVPDSGRHTVVDWRATNGTRIDGEAIVRALLKDGDTIQVGDQTVTYRVELREEVAPVKSAGGTEAPVEAEALSFLAGACRKLDGSGNLPEMIQRYLEVVVVGCRARFGIVLLRDGLTGQLVPEAVHPAGEVGLEDLVPDCWLAAQEAARSGRVESQGLDAQPSPTRSSGHDQCARRPWVAAPIIGPEGTTGALYLLWDAAGLTVPEPGTVPAIDRMMLVVLLASVVARALPGGAGGEPDAPAPEDPDPPHACISSGTSSRCFVDQLLIGRSSELCDVVIADRELSSRHALIFRSGKRYCIADLRSAKGLLVNGQPVAPVRKLTQGDLIRIGTHELRFDVMDRPSAGKGGPGGRLAFLDRAANLLHEKTPLPARLESLLDDLVRSLDAVWAGVDLQATSPDPPLKLERQNVECPNEGTLHFSSAASDHVQRRGTPLFLPPLDLGKHAAARNRKAITMRTVTAIAVPVRRAGRVAGLIEVQNRTWRRVFDRRDFDLMIALGHLVSRAA